MRICSVVMCSDKYHNSKAGPLPRGQEGADTAVWRGNVCTVWQQLQANSIM